MQQSEAYVHAAAESPSSSIAIHRVSVELSNYQSVNSAVQFTKVHPRGITRRVIQESVHEGRNDLGMRISAREQGTIFEGIL